MRFVRALLVVPVRAIAIAIAGAVFRLEALLRRPGLDQGPIHREMVIGQERLHLRMVQKLRHELLKHVAALQPLPVLGERRRVPDGVVRGEPNKPAIQKIIVELLHQLAFRADRVERLKQLGAQQLLRRDRRPPLAGIKLAEARTEVLQNRPHQLPDFPQRMPGRHPRLRRDVGKQPTLIPKVSPHGAPNDS
jgi:hypothetical protein